MSNPLPSFSSLTGGTTKRIIIRDSALPYLDSWSDRRRTQAAFSSSPPPSSPPRTPYSTRGAESYALMRSSPTYNLDSGISPPNYYPDESSPAWTKRYGEVSLSQQTHPQYHAPKVRYPYHDDHDLPPSSEMDICEVMDDTGMSLPEVDSETTSESAPGHSSVYFSDSEEDQDVDGADDDEDGYSFGDGGFRATFFRTSAERGRWRSDPMPLKMSSLLQFRKSVPTPSRVASPTLPTSTRVVSEPLPSPDSRGPTLDVPSIHGQSDNCDEVTSHEKVSAAGVVPESNPTHIAPSLVADRANTPEPDEVLMPSSPLPSSSPPLSPMSGCVSPMSRSVSPISFAPSPIPIPMSYSHPSVISSALVPEGGASDDATLDVTENLSMEPSELNSNNTEEDSAVMSIYGAVNEEPLVALGEDPASSLRMEPNANVSMIQVSLNNESPSDSGVAAHRMPSAQPSSVSPASLLFDEDDAVPSQKILHVKNQAKKSRSLSPTIASNTPSRSVSPSVHSSNVKKPGQQASKLEDDKALRTQDENGAIKPQPKSISSTKAKAASSKAAGLPATEKRKKEASVRQDSAEGPVKKKRRMTTPHESSSVGSSSKASSRPSALQRSSNPDDEDEFSEPAPPPKVKKRADKQPAAGPSTSKRSRVAHPPNSPQKRDHVDSQPEEIDNEIVGMLIECMATSRASSLPVSSLCKSVLQTHPYMKEQRTEKEWVKVLNRVLANGTVGRGSGVFGKVDSSGKDDSDKPLEAQWFYVPEMDEDQDRAALIRSMMPRPAKRNETKKYKQYYWRPLDKISRWDPEDDL